MMTAVSRYAIPVWSVPTWALPGWDGVFVEQPLAAQAVTPPLAVAPGLSELPALQLENTRTQRDLNTIIKYLQKLNVADDGRAHAILADGLTLPARPSLNFYGPGVRVWDDPSGDTTAIVIGPSGPGEDISGAFTGELLDLSITGELILKGLGGNADDMSDGGVIHSDNFEPGVSGWQISHDGLAEFQSAVIRGEITADSGAIGGFTIGTNELHAGVGGARVGLKPGIYPFYAGAEDASMAPFRVTAGGALTATDAEITGQITAESGEIGGFTISSGLLSAGAGATAVGLAPGTYPFYAGAESPAAAPFRVTAAGLLTAQGATIEGALTATTGELVNLDVSGLLNLVAGGIIESDNYAAGLAGWRVDHNGDAEFNNIYARGRIDTAVFQYDQISAVSGSLLVTPTAGALGASYTTAGPLTIEGAAWAFATGDVVRIRALDSAGAVKQVWVTVTRTATLNQYTTTKKSGDDATWPAGTAVLGYGTGGGSLMMTAVPGLKGPRYSILTHGASPWTDEQEIARYGRLDGWQTYPGTDYGIALGDYANGNYLLYGTDTAFKLHAGSGALAIDEDGLSIQLAGSSVWDQAHAVTWVDTSLNAIATITAFEQDYGGYYRDFLTIRLAAEDGRDKQVSFSNRSASAKFSLTQISAMSGVLSQYMSSISLYSDDSQVAGSKSYVSLQAEKLYLNGESYGAASANVIVSGTIRESVPIHLRLSRRGSDQSIPNNSWTMRFFDTVEYGSSQAGIAKADLVWMHSPLTFTGSGLNDLAHLNQPTYPDTVTTQFAVKITSTGATDYFQWSVDGGSTWNGTNIAITGASQSIGGTKDVRIQFGATTGHTLNDRWNWEEYPRSKVIAKQAGLYHVEAAVTINSASGSTIPHKMEIDISKNGNSTQTGMAIFLAGYDTAMNISCSALVWLNVNDFVESPVWQGSEVTKGARAATDANQQFNSITIARVA